MLKKLLLVIFSTLSTFSFSQSIARQWNEEILNGIRNDFARPTVHARNIFHSSIIMYDLWAVFDEKADTYFLGKNNHGFQCAFDGFIANEPLEIARNKAISYGVYRLIQHRFQNAPKFEEILESTNALMQSYNFDINFTSTNYQNGDAAALGNYMAAQIISFGFQDGSNEANGYANEYYSPKNEPLNTDISGNETMQFPNNWQPLKLEAYVDQSGNVIPGGQPPFLSPEWGRVAPFALTENERTIFNTPDYDFWVYHNPGAPAYIKEGLGIEDAYKWNFALVSSWSSHLDTADGILIDISPKSIGNINIETLPKNFSEYKNFYDFENGGDPSLGRTTNPKTGEPYNPQIVLRGDYTRVLAEFWADGPDSETPPGHWFTIMNYVNDSPQLIKKLKGRGEILSDLEWDIKAYFILGGAMHDAAVTAWGIKGYYDYVRPISALRYMADHGQSSDPNLPSYDPHGMPLVPGKIELVLEGDPLAGAFNENLGKIKVFSWRGPSYIVNPLIDIAGVDWILAEEWFPYQRPSFVTPPFAGYVSGHSTFSRAAAEVLTALTGDAYFPGGMGVFNITANEFLVFEDGPTQDMELQWATYRDASDQCSLSRIWGGIHPPIDDIPGRIAGEKIGKAAFAFGEKYFTGELATQGILFPNPAEDEVSLLYSTKKQLTVSVFDMLGRLVFQKPADFNTSDTLLLDVSKLSEGIYFIDLFEGKNKVWTNRLVKK